MSNLPAQYDMDMFGNLDQTDFVTPRCTIGQPTGKGTPGKFNFNNGATYDKLSGVVMLVPSKRRFLGAKDNKVACASDNFYDPSARIQSPICGQCAELDFITKKPVLSCFAAAWGEDPAKDNLAKKLGVNLPGKKPLCQETYELLLWSEETGPFTATFSKTQINIISEKWLSRLRISRRPIYASSIDLNLDKMASPAVYYSLRLDNFKEVTGDLLAELKNTYEVFKPKADKIVTDTYEKMAEEKKEQDPFRLPTPDYTPAFDSNDEIPF